MENKIEKKYNRLIIAVSIIVPLAIVVTGKSLTKAFEPSFCIEISLSLDKSSLIKLVTEAEDIYTTPSSVFIS